LIDWVRCCVWFGFGRLRRRINRFFGGIGRSVSRFSRFEDGFSRMGSCFGHFLVFQTKND
jgi:hypothetical protein